MKNLRLLNLLSIVLMALTGYSQPAEYKMTRQEYIERYKDDAIKEMLIHGVPASITLAQGMLESGNGNSALAVYANNHFGIKCHTTWFGPTYIQDDDDKNECFRKYGSALESYTDHSIFLRTRARYAFLFEIKPIDYKAWAYGLKKAGYATEPKYPERLIDIIEAHKLYLYDEVSELPTLKAENKTVKNSITAVTTKVILVNNIKCVLVKEGDTFLKIANDYDVELWQLYKYNDLDKNTELKAGMKLYLQPKRKKAEEPFHTVKRGETMKSISQLHGIKLKELYKKNLMKSGDEPKPGEILSLRKKRQVND